MDKAASLEYMGRQSCRSGPLLRQIVVREGKDWKRRGSGTKPNKIFSLCLPASILWHNLKAIVLEVLLVNKDSHFKFCEWFAFGWQVMVWKHHNYCVVNIQLTFDNRGGLKDCTAREG